MTSPQNVSRTRSIVLGGGGVVGVAWQTGLLKGLREAGIEFAGASETVGTSAGAIVGALLSSGRDVADALGMLAAVVGSIPRDRLAAAHGSFLAILRQASLAADPQQALRAIGAAALEATSALSEDEYLRLFEIFDGAAWPAGFGCTAIDAETGEFVVWRQDSGVPLLQAVASSCVIPLLFPAVTIKGRPYLDGGLLSHLNATAAAPTDVLVAISCLPLMSTGGRPESELPASTKRANAELAQVHETTRLIAVDPDFRELKTPVNMMDPETAKRALQIGQRQAEREAPAILAAWGEGASR